MDLRFNSKLLGMGTLLVALSLSLIGANFPALDQEKVVDQCCFVHPNYAGVCEVTPAEDETCENILLYLNSPTTGGKTYCGNTKIRGGWEKTECPGQE